MVLMELVFAFIPPRQLIVVAGGTTIDMEANPDIYVLDPLAAIAIDDHQTTTTSSGSTIITAADSITPTIPITILARVAAIIIDQHLYLGSARTEVPSVLTYRLDLSHAMTTTMEQQSGNHDNDDNGDMKRYVVGLVDLRVTHFTSTVAYALDVMDPSATWIMLPFTLPVIGASITSWYPR